MSRGQQQPQAEARRLGAAIRENPARLGCGTRPGRESIDPGKLE